MNISQINFSIYKNQKLVFENIEYRDSAGSGFSKNAKSF